MTTKRDLKKLIRDRMKKTGESYSSARRALQAEPPAPPDTNTKAAKHHSHVGAGEIEGWIATGQAPQDYEFKVDAPGYRSSRSAMVRARKEKPSGFGTLTQRFVPDDYRGQRVRLSGWVRSEGVTGSCKLWMRVEMPDKRVVAFGQSSLITHTTDWAQYQVVLDVAQGAAVLAFGILLENGAGTTWLSDVNIEIVANDVPTSNLIDISLAHQARNLDFSEQAPRSARPAVDELCERLLRDSNALAVVLLDRRGEELATAGDRSLLNAATVRAFGESLGRPVADLVANQEFAGQLHDAANAHLHVASLVAERAVLAVLFDNQSSLGLVRLRMKKASDQLTRILADDPTGSGGSGPAAAPIGSSGSPAPMQTDDRDEPLH